MAKLLFKLRGVPDDESQDVRELLTAHDIDYYETSAGNWGISMPGIWLKDETQLDQAKALIERYQQERYTRERDKYEQAVREGRQRTLMDAIKEAPLRFVIYVAIIVLVAYVSISPFLSLWE